MLLLYIRAVVCRLRDEKGGDKTTVHILKMGSTFRGAYLLTRKVEFCFDDWKAEFNLFSVF